MGYKRSANADAVQKPCDSCDEFRGILVRSRDQVKILFMIKIKIDQLFLKGTRDKNVSLPWKSGTRGRGQNKLLLENFSEANQKARATRELPPRPDLVELYGPRSLRQL